MSSPYENLPARAFWKTGVSQQRPETVTGLYEKRFDIPRDARIATAGSCFAQHIARYLRNNGYHVLDLEPAPPGLNPEDARALGYNLYSARYGNIYTARQFRQLIQEALGRQGPSDWIWERDGRYFDALRPAVEPDGLGSPEEVIAHRQQHLAAVRRMLRSAGLFVFTMGLTEAWINRRTGTVYPTAPGTIAGSYDPALFEFKNFTFEETYADMVAARKLILRRNPGAKFLITVSPVPLTATASGGHVLTATTYSKSVLRAVAGQLYAEFPDVDYFPSYELVASPFSRGEFFEDNLRSVRDSGVQSVMRVFFSEHSGAVAPAPAAKPRKRKKETTTTDEEDVVCEEVLLEAFAR